MYVYVPYCLISQMASENCHLMMNSCTLVLSGLTDCCCGVVDLQINLWMIMVAKMASDPSTVGLALLV